MKAAEEGEKRCKRRERINERVRALRSAAEQAQGAAGSTERQRIVMRGKGGGESERGGEGEKREGMC